MSRGYFLNSDLLEAFIRSFFGYGNLKAPVWFIGMEEGGGNSLKEVHDRLRAWNRRGRKRIEDAAAFHIRIKMDNLFLKADGGGPTIQGTWRKLILVVLACRGNENLGNRQLMKEAVREFQRTTFGRKTSCIAALELFPLPSPNRESWNYGCGQGVPKRRWTRLPYLRTRPIYEKSVIDDRTKLLKQLIARYNPKCVVLYGKAFRQHWGRLADHEFMPNEDGTLIGNGPTKYLLLPHPSRFSKDQTFLNAGVTMQIGGIRV